MPNEEKMQWHCVRQHAGPLVKECRALRPRLTPKDTAQDARSKRDLQSYAHSAVCRTQVDRLELKLALFGFEGTHYTCTYDSLHLPHDFDGVRRSFRAFRSRLQRCRKGAPYDWIGCIEGLHGDHRLHIHCILRNSQIPPGIVRRIWTGGDVDVEPVLQREGGYRRLAEYLNKERPDGFVIPIGKHPWSCSRTLNSGLPPAERWMEDSSAITVPDDVLWSRRGARENDFGAYYYASYILPRNSTLPLDNVARAPARPSILKYSGK